MIDVGGTTAPTPPTKGFRARRLAARVAWAVFPFAVLLAAWQLVTAAELVPRIWLPSPMVVWDTFVELVQSGTWLKQILASLGRLLLGIVVSGTIGIGLGVLMGIRRGFAEFVGPLITFLNALSGIVWIPLAILWFGLGPLTVTFVIWNSMFFLILLNTLVGVKSVPRIYESALLTMGGSRWRVVRDVLVPGALPNIVTGLRLGIGFGWRALIAAELFAASDGIGHMLFTAASEFRSDIILVGLITIGVMWLAVDRFVLVPFETWTIRRWHLVTVS